MESWKNKKITTNNGVIKHISKLNETEIIDLYIKCSTDYIYTIETFFEIFDQSVNKIVPFKLFEFQKEIIRAYEANRLNLTNKYRQAGISTVSCAYIACYIAFNENRKVAIVADKLETARDELMRDVVEFIDMLPPFLHPQLTAPNKATHKGYANGSEVKAYATKKFRGMTPTLLFWDEVAHCENGENFWTAVWPSLATGSDCLFVSCVTKDTYIWTDKGMSQIKDYVENSNNKSYHVDDYSVLGKNKSRKGNIFHNNGKHKTKIIKSNYSELEGTFTHKLYTYDSGNGIIDWHKMGDVNKKHLISIQYGMKISGTEDKIEKISNTQTNKKFHTVELNKEMMCIFSHYITDSERSFNAIPKNTLNNVSEEQFNRYNKILIDDFGINPNHIKYEDNKLTISYFRFDNIITKTGLKETHKIQEIPRFFWSLKYDLLYELTYCLFESCDDNLEIETKSLKFIKQLRQILLNMGYLTSITDNSKYTGGFSYKNSFTLKINKINKDDLRKNKKIVYDYVIPLGFIDFINKQLDDKNQLDLHFYSLKELKKTIKDKNIQNDVIENILSDNIYWDKITHTQKSFAETFDFSLPNDENDYFAHSVIYNGIVGHQTPNGLDPVFYKTYDAAKNGHSKFNINEIYWYEDPRYNKGLKWIKTVSAEDPEDPDKMVEVSFYDEKRDNFQKYIRDGYYPTSDWFEGMCMEYKYDKNKINQEIKGDFLGSGNNFISNEDIQYYERTYQIEPIRKEYNDKTWIWEEPVKNEKYILISDVSSGTAEDYSTIEVLKMNDNELIQVMEFQGKVSPDILGDMCYRYAIRYNNAYTIVDITGGIGVTTVQRLLDLGYKNLHYSQIRNEKIKERLITYAKIIDDKVYIPGFTIGTNRGMILIEMKRVIEMREIILKSSRLMSEFKTFLTHESRVADHRRSFHDDLIIAIAMGVYVISYEISNPENQRELMKQMLLAMANANNTEEDVIKEEPKIIHNTNKNVISNPNNYAWLFKGLK